MICDIRKTIAEAGGSQVLPVWNLLDEPKSLAHNLSTAQALAKTAVPAAKAWLDAVEEHSCVCSGLKVGRVVWHRRGFGQDLREH